MTLTCKFRNEVSVIISYLATYFKTKSVGVLAMAQMQDFTGLEYLRFLTVQEPATHRASSIVKAEREKKITHIDTMLN